MQLKLKLAAIGSAVWLAASMGVVFAGPAAAQTAAHLCVIDSKNVTACIGGYPTTKSYLVVSYDTNTSSAFNTPSVFGEITWTGNSSLCIQYHGPVWLNKCTGVASEEWTAEAGALKGTTIFFSAYNTSYCLNLDPYSSPDATITVAKCSTARNNVNQEWHQP